jgi:hypothetical protein
VWWLSKGGGSVRRGYPKPEGEALLARVDAATGRAGS